MKLKNRIIVGFMMVILVPLLLFAAALFGISETQHRNAVNSESAQETSYDITISDTGSSQARIQIMTKDLFFTAFIILIFTGVSVGLWIYRSVAAPLVKLRKATQNIKEGNLDFVLDVEGTDEFSELCRDFEEMRRRLKESAEEKIAMDKENKELISNISHDLKTPITAVKGYVEGIMDGVADTPEKMDRYVRTIYNKTNEMDHLINELTFYSKIDTNRIPYTFSKLNVDDYFSDCAEEVGLELETRGIQLYYANYVEKDVLVIADGEQIRRVIHNIISNAIKYNKPNGKIIATAEVVNQTEDYVTCRFMVKDTGIGMSDDFQKNMFDPFSQEYGKDRSEFRGTELELSIVKRIVDQMGGEIRVESKKGVGTTFTWTLTFKTDKEYREEKVAANQQDFSLAGKKILAAEDNTLNAEILIFLLDDMGADTVLGENGKQVVESFKESDWDEYDCILMDVMMPIMDGYTATRRIRGLSRPDAQSIPIIALTANAFAEDRKKAMEAGMNDHVAKPVDMKVLTAVLQKYLEK